MRTQSIRKLGLKKHLEATKTIHNNFGYDNFVVMLASGVNVSNIAKAYNVDRRTVVKWLQIYKEEQ